MSYVPIVVEQTGLMSLNRRAGESVLMIFTPDY